MSQFKGTGSRSSDDPAAGEPSGAPASMAAAEAGAVAGVLHHGISATGDRAASRLGQISWAMFDFARTPYVLLITIYIFAPYFTNTLVADPVKGQAIWGDIQGYSGLIIAMLAPFIGAIADAGGRRKPWIAVFSVVMIVATAALWYAQPGGMGLSLLAIGVLVAATNVAYEFSSVFYNAMLPTITQHERIGALSGLGLALGNVSGLLLLIFLLIGFVLPGAVHWSFIPAHALFGIDQAAHEPERLTGPMSAACILIFAMPLFFLTPDRAGTRTNWIDASVRGFKSVIRTTRSLKHYKNVATYLFARLFFNDGMTALLTFGGVYAAGIFHWHALAMTAYGITLSIFAIFGGFFGGWLDDHFGSKAALFISVGGTAILGLLSVTMGPDRIFWFIPYDIHAPHVNGLPFFNTWPELIFLGILVLVAITVTASYANARTMMARIAPVERMTEFFGLFSLSGQSTSFLATLSVAWITGWTHSQRGGFIVVVAFLIVGLIGMFWVKEERAESL
ncbi:MAG TPA: MFS transporter [Rhizomicrobium sp.]